MTDSARPRLMKQAQEFFGPKFIYLGDAVDFAEDARQQTAREIADWLDADAPTHDDGMYGGIATETLRQAAKKIREKYVVQP